MRRYDSTRSATVTLPATRLSVSSYVNLLVKTFIAYSTVKVVSLVGEVVSVEEFTHTMAFVYTINYDFDAVEEGEMACRKGDVVVSESKWPSRD